LSKCTHTQPNNDTRTLMLLLLLLLLLHILQG
jgi:hypothetical protein